LKPPADGVRRALPSACALLALSWAATLVLEPWSDERVGDLGVRREYAEAFLGGALPYRDLAFEYPPLAAPLITAPGLAGTSPDAYWAGFAILTFALAVAVLALAGRLAELTGGDRWLAMVGVALCPLLLGAVVRTHFDWAPVALALGGLVAILSRRPALGFALLGIGAMTKAFPLVIAPVALAWLLGRGERSAAMRGAVALAATVAAVAAAGLALSPSGTVAAVRYQLERPVQVESTPASTLFAIDALGGAEPVVAASHRSAGLTHWLADAIATGFAAVALGAVAWLVFLAARAARREPPGPRPDGPAARALVLASLTSVAALVAFGKVLSPQFLIWIVPLLALALAWRQWALAALTVAAAALTLVEFPSRYLDLVAGEPVAVGVTALRNGALVAALALAIVALMRRPRVSGGSARSTALARPARRRRSPRSATGPPPRSRTSRASG